MRNHPLGIYEKRWRKISPAGAAGAGKSCGFDFVEMSVDETDERLSRLDWSAAQRASLVTAMIETGVAIPSMCLSAHRRFPFGSRDDAVRQRAREIMSKAIRPARDPAFVLFNWQVTTSITRTMTKAPSNGLLKGWRGRLNRQRHHKSCWQWRLWTPRL